MRWWLIAHGVIVIAVAATMGAVWWHPERLRWALPVVAAIGTVGGTFAGMYAGKCAVWTHVKEWL